MVEKPTKSLKTRLFITMSVSTGSEVKKLTRKSLNMQTACFVYNLCVAYLANIESIIKYATLKKPFLRQLKHD